MTDITQRVNNEGDPNRYFSMIEHIADDDLAPYEYRLLGHYKRVCGVNGGKCTESVRKTAEKCKMSTGQVSKSRRELERLGWVRTTVHARETENGHVVIEGMTITLVNRMADNIARYANEGIDTRSPGEQVQGEGCSHSEQGCSPGETKKNLELKKEEHIVRKRTPEQQKLDTMIEALVDALGLDRDKIAKSLWSELRGAGKQLLDVGATPDEMVALYTWCSRQRWGGTWGAHAMAKNYANFDKERSPSQAQPAKTETASQHTRAALYEGAAS